MAVGILATSSDKRAKLMRDGADKLHPFRLVRPAGRTHLEV